MEDYMIKDLYPGTTMLSGYPRNSAFFHKKRYQQIRKELKLENKQVIVYMPTWRGLLHKKETAKQLETLRKYFINIDKKLTDSQVFYVKLHPFVKSEMYYSSYEHIKDIPDNYETYDFLNASDMLVTDYSSIMFDFAVTGRKIILFTYDREEYKNGRGLYIDLEDLEFPKADTVEELIDELNSENKGYPNFHKQFCSYDSINTPRQVLETLLFGSTKQHEDYRADTVVSDGRKKVCIFIKGMKHDYYTEKLIEAINSINLKKYDVYVCMKANNVKNASDMLSKLKKEINYIPITYNVNYTVMDYILCKLRLKLGIKIGLTNNRVEKVMKREIRKYFGEAEFDYVLHHSEFDRMVGSMCSLLGTKTIYNFKYFNYNKYKENILPVCGMLYFLCIS
jgi:hypothetical protein